MTSVVKVSAHCSDDKQVRITSSNGTEKILQNGQSAEMSIYDDISVTAQEELKEAEGDEQVSD